MKKNNIIIILFCILLINCKEKTNSKNHSVENSGARTKQNIYAQINFDVKSIESGRNIEYYELHRYKFHLNSENEKTEIIINNKSYPIELNFTYDTDSNSALSNIKIFQNFLGDEMIFIPTFGSNDEYTYQILLLKNEVVYENVISFSALSNLPHSKQIQIIEENNLFKIKVGNINLETDFKKQVKSDDDSSFLKMQEYSVSKGGNSSITSSNRISIDSLIFDFNNDQIIDKILIQAHAKEVNASEKEYFDNINLYSRTLVVLRGEKNNSFTQITSNKNIIPCLRCNEPMNAYSDFKQMDSSSFSVHVIQKANRTIYRLIFEWRGDGFYLKQLGEQTFNDENFKILKFNSSVKLNDFNVNNILTYTK